MATRTTTKKATAKKAAAKKSAVKANIAGKIDPEVQEELIKAIMAEPGACASGKRKFLAKYGFPVPPKEWRVTFTVSTTQEDGEATGRDYYSNIYANATTRKKLNAALAKLLEGSRFTIAEDSTQAVISEDLY